ncbi:MAG: transcriptional regulator [Saprospiraceae bacterium]|nr:transcriptional regulator [Saprospiraceae bacterium]
MHLTEAKAKFIESWGKLGSNWGVSRTMAQIHALLIVAKEPLCADQIMEALKISRGNVNINVHALIDWGLVQKVLKPGDRKDYFQAEKDVMLMMKQIILHRKRKELDPMVKVLNEISCVESQCPDSAEFCRMIKELKRYSEKADKTLDTILTSESNWMYSAFFRAVT